MEVLKEGGTQYAAALDDAQWLETPFKIKTAAKTTVPLNSNW